MSISNSDYSKMTDKASPNSPTVLNCVKAFLIGGAICTFAQLLNILFQNIGLSEKDVKIATPGVVIVITAILTGIGVFDKIDCSYFGFCQFRCFACTRVSAGGFCPRHCRTNVFNRWSRYCLRCCVEFCLRFDNLYF